MKTEAIEAFIHPDMDLFRDMGEKRGAEYKTDEIEAIMSRIVDEVNKDLLGYKEIFRNRVLNEPMEMTTTKKIKPHKIGETV